MSTVVVRDDTNEDAVIRGSVVGYSVALGPIVISETQIVDKRQQRMKGLFFVLSEQPTSRLDSRYRQLVIVTSGEVAF